MSDANKTMTKPNELPELKDCPKKQFREIHIVRLEGVDTDESYEYYVQCSCGHHNRNGHESKLDAVKAWNAETNVPLDKDGKTIAALKPCKMPDDYEHWDTDHETIWKAAQEEIIERANTRPQAADVEDEGGGIIALQEQIATFKPNSDKTVAEELADIRIALGLIRAECKHAEAEYFTKVVDKGVTAVCEKCGIRTKAFRTAQKAKEAFDLKLFDPNQTTPASPVAQVDAARGGKG